MGLCGLIAKLVILRRGPEQRANSDAPCAFDPASSSEGQTSRLFEALGSGVSSESEKERTWELPDATHAHARTSQGGQRRLTPGDTQRQHTHTHTEQQPEPKPSSNLNQILHIHSAYLTKGSKQATWPGRTLYGRE